MNASDVRAERLRRVNRYKAVQAELARQKEEADFVHMRERKMRSAACDAALAEELAAQQRLDIKDEKMLQLVSDFPEVRQLQRILKGAYLKKNRSEQVIGRGAKREEEEREQREYLAFLVEQERQAKEEDERKKATEIARFKVHQEAQLNLIRGRKQAAEEEAKQLQQERIAVDAVVARVQEEDFLAALNRREKQRIQQEEHDELYRIRAELKKAEAAREAKEEAAIQAYLAEQTRRKEMEAKISRERDAVKARVLEEQGRRMAEEREKKLELENLLHEYYEEERIAKDLALIRAEKESRVRMSEVAAQENAELIESRRKAREEELIVEMRHRQEAMEEMAAQVKLDQLTKQRQIQLRLEQNAAARRRIEEREALKQREMELERQVDEADRKREEEIQEYIRRAREQLLREHIPKLGEFAPINVLKPEERVKFALPEIIKK